MTEQEYINTLDQEDKDYIAYLRSKTNKIPAYILVDEQIIETDLIISCIWMSENSTQIADTTVNNKRVSTVFLPFCHDNFHFETMVFEEKEAKVAGKYTTLEEAHQGHIHAVHCINS